MSRKLVIVIVCLFAFLFVVILLMRLQVRHNKQLAAEIVARVEAFKVKVGRYPAELEEISDYSDQPPRTYGIGANWFFYVLRTDSSGNHYYSLTYNDLLGVQATYVSDTGRWDYDD